MSFEYLNKITQRYTNLLENRGEQLRKDEDGNQTDLGHLLWMLEEIRTNPDQSETKKNRWLGFIQGITIQPLQKDRPVNRPPTPRPPRGQRSCPIFQ
jgi:hypothetical protein